MNADCKNLTRELGFFQIKILECISKRDPKMYALKGNPKI